MEGRRPRPVYWLVGPATAGALGLDYQSAEISHTTSAAVLLQDYFDRWGIEVNHRDVKEILGVGQAQVWNEKSVSKVPALLVAM